MRAPPYSTRVDELFAPETIEDPFPLFARLRNEHPISRVGDSGVHLVASWDLIDQVLQREADFSANLTGVLIRTADGAPGIFELSPFGADHVIATADEPAHAVHRAIAQPRLAAPRITALEAPIRNWTREAAGPWLERGGGDFVPISERIPAHVIAAVLGLPDRDVGRHRKWAMLGGDILAGDIRHERLIDVMQTTAEMSEYLGRHLEAVGNAPRHEAGAPLLHALARSVLGGDIETRHAIGIAIVMFGAGGESTAALIGSAVRRLAEAPELAELLRRDPTLIPRFVEEVARLEPPFKFHYRAVRHECLLGDVELGRGDRLMLLWASANRDETQFEAPNALCLERRHPKHHMSFGRGGHFCIGAPLARLEARIVCEEVLDRTSKLAVSRSEAPVHTQSIFVRRLDRLPLEARRSG